MDTAGNPTMNGMIAHKVRNGLPVLLVLLAGCGDKNAPVSLSGIVTLDGKSLARATVRFIHQKADGRDALGSTDADGRFSLSTLKPGDGVLPGSYKVVVQPPTAGDPNASATNVLEAMQASGRADRPRGPSVYIPARYSNPGQTILQQEVPAEGEVLFELESE